MAKKQRDEYHDQTLLVVRDSINNETIWDGSNLMKLIDADTLEERAVTTNDFALGAGGAGDATAANQVELNTRIGATNESTAATDNANSGLNGLFKRLLGKVPSLGQTTMSAAQPITIASDQTPLADLLVTGTLGANTSDTVEINTQGRAGLTLKLENTWTGTCVFDVLNDEGSTWTSIDGVATGTSSAWASSSTVNVTMRFAVAGFRKFRVRKSVAGTGTVSVSLNASVVSNITYIRNTASGNVPVLATQGTAGATPWPVDTRRSVSPVFLPVSVSTINDNVLVAAVASNKIKILHYTLVADSAVAVKFTSGAGGADMTGAMSFAATGGVVSAFAAPGQGHILETAVNTALILNLSVGVGVRGHLVYVLEP